MRVALIAAIWALIPSAAPRPLAWWEAWPSQRFMRTPAPCLRPAELRAQLDALAAAHRERLALEQVGQSVEGRPIHLLRLGRGPRVVMLWSQMHGDEPSATPALLDVADHLLRSQEPHARRILEAATLLMIPMLNPDGAERYQRRNAQEIDVNRDALNLATPEGRLLKAVRDRHRPELGFNLHDQNRRTTVGDTGVLASISLLAVAGDPEGTVTPGRLVAKRVCSALVAALSPFVPGGVARYDEDWSPRAFGDNLTAWGTPVVLIESGGLPPGRPFTDLTRLNFVAILSALDALVSEGAQAHDPAVYESLPRNDGSGWSDVVLRGGEVIQPGLPAPYRADVAFDRRVSDQTRAQCAPDGSGSRITEVGDARFLGAGESVDVTGAVIAPAFVVSVRGLTAQAWLDAAGLDRLAQLGVGTVRWHVADLDRPAADAHAAAVASPGRPTLAPVSESAPSVPVLLASRPRAARSSRIADVLEALGTTWRPSRDDQPLAFLPQLAAAAGTPLTLDAPASLLVLRGADAWADPARVRLERVWIDGRP
jgi:hypothetical protein